MNPAVMMGRITSAAAAGAIAAQAGNIDSWAEGRYGIAKVFEYTELSELEAELKEAAAHAFGWADVAIKWDGGYTDDSRALKMTHSRQDGKGKAVSGSTKFTTIRLAPHAKLVSFELVDDDGSPCLDTIALAIELGKKQKPAD